MKLLDMREHQGVHPRFGVLDVVPFVALDPRKAEEAISMRNEAAAWVADTFDVPVFLFGRLRDGSSARCPKCAATPFIHSHPISGP